MRFLKSGSLLIKITFFFLAAVNTSESLASRKPSARKETASFPGNVSLIQCAMDGEMCSSIQKIIRQLPDDRVWSLHTSVQPLYLVLQDQANLLESARVLVPQTTGQEYQSP